MPENVFDQLRKEIAAVQKRKLFTRPSNSPIVDAVINDFNQRIFNTTALVEPRSRGFIDSATDVIQELLEVMRLGVTQIDRLAANSEDQQKLIAILKTVGKLIIRNTNSDILDNLDKTGQKNIKPLIDHQEYIRLRSAIEQLDQNTDPYTLSIISSFRGGVLENCREQIESRYPIPKDAAVKLATVILKNTAKLNLLQEIYDDDEQALQQIEATKAKSKEIIETFVSPKTLANVKDEEACHVIQSLNIRPSPPPAPRRGSPPPSPSGDADLISQKIITLLDEHQTVTSAQEITNALRQSLIDGGRTTPENMLASVLDACDSIEEHSKKKPSLSKEIRPDSPLAKNLYNPQAEQALVAAIKETLSTLTLSPNTLQNLLQQKPNCRAALQALKLLPEQPTPRRPAV